MPLQPPHTTDETNDADGVKSTGTSNTVCLRTIILYPTKIRKLKGSLSVRSSFILATHPLFAVIECQSLAAEVCWSITPWKTISHRHRRHHHLFYDRIIHIIYFLSLCLFRSRILIRQTSTTPTKITTMLTKNIRTHGSLFVSL